MCDVQANRLPSEQKHELSYVGIKLSKSCTKSFSLTLKFWEAFYIIETAVQASPGRCEAMAPLHTGGNYFYI